MLPFLDPWREFTFASTVIKLVLVLVCGGAIGYERGHRGRAAGLRTHSLVALGACLVMLTNLYIVNYISPGADPARLGAQVISGIGFLGAGSIMITGRQITGLTTAAGLWSAACIGLAIGIGFYEGAILATIITLFTMTVLHNLENRLPYRSTLVELLVELKKSGDLAYLLEELKSDGVNIVDMEISDNEKRVTEPGNLLVQLSLQVSRSFRVESVAARLHDRIELVTFREI